MSSQNSYDVDINKAIELSLRDTNIPADIAGFEPLNPEQRLRKKGMPVGLKNVGNSKNARNYFFKLIAKLAT